MYRSNINQTSDALHSRVLELTAQETPWQRRLLSTNFLTKIDELVLAAEWASRHVLSQTSIKKLVSELRAGVKNAPSLPDGKQKKRLIELLSADFSENTAELHSLVLFLNELKEGYWRNISAWLSASGEVDTEILARQIASKLLDDGFSHKRAQELIRNVKGQPINEVLMYLEIETSRGKGEFEFLFPVTFKKGSETALREIPKYVSGAELARYIEDAPPTQGAFLINAKGLDVWAASEVARQIVATLMARIKFTNFPKPHLHSDFFETSNKKWLSVESPQGHARVNSLKKQGGIFEILKGQSDNKSKNHVALDNALEMAMSLQSQNMAQAISGGWSAMESLLRTTEKRDATGFSVQRTAALIASASLPRAELTALANRVNSKTNGDLRQEIESKLTNREKATILQKVLLSNNFEIRTDYGWRHDVDQIALRKIQNGLTSPTAYIKGISAEIEHTLDQYYRQRNIVTHGGESGGRIMSASARVSTPIIAAVLDRITHLTFTEDLGIREIVARAHHNVSRLDEAKPDFVGLLEANEI